MTYWLDRKLCSSIWNSPINLCEIGLGLLAMPPGRRRAGLESHIEQILRLVIQDRLLHFNAESAKRAAELPVERRRLGQPVEIRDTMIDGIVLASRAKLAMRDMKRFEAFASPAVNPWEKG